MQPPSRCRMTPWSMYTIGMLFYTFYFNAIYIMFTLIAIAQTTNKHSLTSVFVIIFMPHVHTCIDGSTCTFSLLFYTCSVYTFLLYYLIFFFFFLLSILLLFILYHFLYTFYLLITIYHFGSLSAKEFQCSYTTGATINILNLEHMRCLGLLSKCSLAFVLLQPSSTS